MEGMATTPSVGTTQAQPPVLPWLRHGGHGGSTWSSTAIFGEIPSDQAKD
jgi:hypothetical protein